MHHRDSQVDCHNFLYEFSFHSRTLQNNDSKETIQTILQQLGKSEHYKFVVQFRGQNMVYHQAWE